MQHRNKIFLLIILLLLIFITCSKKTDKYNYYNYKKLKDSDNIVKLYSSVFNKNELFFPSAFLVTNDYLILNDDKADKLLNIYDLKSNNLLKSFGTLGQGPSEFIGVRQIIQDQEDNDSFWIYDISTRKIKKYNIKNVLDDNFYPDKIINLTSECGVPSNLIFTSDDRIFGVGIYFKCRIAIFNMNGAFIKSVGDIPVKLKKEEFAFQHSHGFDGNFIIKKKTKEIFISPIIGSIIEKYSIDGKLIRTLVGPDPFYPEYNIVPAGKSYSMAYNKNTRKGFIDIKYNETLDRIYVLYSGIYQFNKEKIQSSYGKYIYVLNNKDEIVEKIELDTPISRMNISNDGSKIYGTTELEVRIFNYIKK